MFCNKVANPSMTGISISDVALPTKNVTLKGMNGLKNVVINSFDLPSNDPAGGITLVINSTITNVGRVLCHSNVANSVFVALASRYCAQLAAVSGLLRSNKPRARWFQLGYYTRPPLNHRTSVNWQAYPANFESGTCGPFGRGQQFCAWVKQ